MSDRALDLTSISHSYDGEPALVDVDLHVLRGEVVAVVGPSGSGKSTLLAVAGGLLTPDSGARVVDGEDLDALPRSRRERHRREQVGFIFQSANLVPYLTARENLVAIEVLRGRDRHLAAREADELLESLDLAAKADRLPGQLSGGERQRVGIGRALMGRPAVILADEPTASLDGPRGRAVVGLLRAQAAERGVGAVVVTHDERVLDLVDRVVRLEDGRVVVDQSVTGGMTPATAGEISGSAEASGA
jgi:putative ABC transport system ATP-binding protein